MYFKYGYLDVLLQILNEYMEISNQVSDEALHLIRVLSQDTGCLKKGFPVLNSNISRLAYLSKMNKIFSESRVMQLLNEPYSLVKSNYVNENKI